jgi:hypothetical protein
LIIITHSAKVKGVDALTLSRRLAALPALVMQRTVLRETLEALSAPEAALLCGELVQRGRDGAPYDIAVLALTAVLDGNDLGYERHGELYAEARRLGDGALARLLLSAQPPPPGKPVRVAIPGRPEITLGERKSLARGSRTTREVLDRLMRDPDPSVLRLLVENPRITEADVVRIAALRPTTAAAQRVLFSSERFIARYQVKRALVFNPYTPSDLAARLVPLLTRTDLLELSGDSKVSGTVRTAAREMLAKLPPI